MRIVFCGSGEFATPSLRDIISGSHELAGVVTQPSRPAGRGGKMKATPIADFARGRGVEVLECRDINADESVEAIRQWRPDVICVVDFGQMIRSAVRDVAPLGAFNLHGSLLPQLRGAAPVNWAIVRGYRRTGVTTFSLVDEMDAGPIYLQAETQIQPGQTAEQLRPRLAEIGAALVGRTLGLLAAGPVTGTPQDHSKATFAPRLKKSDGWIDWSADAAAIRNRIHGLWPWPGGQAIFRRSAGRPVPVTIALAEALAGEGAAPGRLDDDLVVGTAAGRLGILEIKPAGKRRMSWRDFVNGYRVSAGDEMAKPTA